MMTLREFNNAVNGFGKLQQEQNESLMFAARQIAFYAVTPHVDPKKSKIRWPSDLWEMDIDKKINEDRISKMKPVEVIKNDTSWSVI